MVNRSKDKGTATETAVVRFLREHGFPYAERRALAGNTDLGDVTGCPGLVFEVKYGGSSIKMGEWMTETLQEQVNAHADYGILVIKPPGVGATQTHRWYAVMTAAALSNLVIAALAQLPEIPFIASGEEALNTRTLQHDFAELRKAAEPGQLAVLTRRPPGTKDRPHDWYQIMSLEDVTILLRTAGYGTPME